MTCNDINIAELTESNAAAIICSPTAGTFMIEEAEILSCNRAADSEVIDPASVVKWEKFLLQIVTPTAIRQHVDLTQVMKGHPKMLCYIKSKQFEFAYIFITFFFESYCSLISFTF